MGEEIEVGSGWRQRGHPEVHLRIPRLSGGALMLGLKGHSCPAGRVAGPQLPLPTWPVSQRSLLTSYVRRDI